MDVKHYRLRRAPTAAPPDEAALLRDLDAEQRAAVTAPAGYVLIAAGAGTGKTRTLTYRAARLIRRGTPPERMLLCTFTNRAARQMRERVEGLLGAEVRGVWCGTFHHLGARVLRQYGEALGISPRFTILDRSDAEDLLAQVIGARPARQRVERFPQPRLLGAMISLSAGTQLSLERVVEERFSRFAHQSARICEVAERYRTRKRALDVLDFDDLLTGWLELLREQPSVAAELTGRFAHILVDEYQDVNRLQAEIAEQMAEGCGSLTVVGDDDQSIYAFRGAWSEAMLQFVHRHPETRVYRLQTNYRSTPEILALANASIFRNRHRLDKLLVASRPPGPRPVAVSVQDVDQQAAFVAQRVLELHEEEGYALAEMAVLFRNHAHGLELQVELTRRKIPFRLRAGLRFFEQAHVKDVLAHLRWLVNPSDPLAGSRVLRLQPGVGPAMTARVLDLLETLEPARLVDGLQACLTADRVTGAGRSSLRRLVGLVEALEQAPSPGEAIRRVVQGPYEAIARSRYADAEERLGDLMQLADYAERYAAAAPFLEEIALMQGLVAEAVGPGEAPEDCLTLSTVHQAKGLEWKVVFVIWLCDGEFPSALALRDPEGEQEERRLFHVAVTRAQQMLTLVHPVLAASGRRERVIRRPSRLLSELPETGLLERWRVVEEGADEEQAGA